MKNVLSKAKEVKGKGHGEKFSRKDEEAICALITEPTVGAAAKKVGIGERTLRHWLRKPDFRARWEDERMHRLEAATRDLDGAAATAIYRLSEILDQTVDPRACIAAAKVILDAVSKKAQIYNVERRLSVLERKNRAPEKGQRVDDTGAEPEILADESDADAPHLAPVCKVPGPTPSIKRKSRPGTESPARPERGGGEKPTTGPIFIHRRVRRKDNEKGARKAG